MQRIVSMIAVGLLVLAAGTAAAQQTAPAGARIAYVNTEKLLRDSRTSQQVAKTLEAEYTKREKEIAAGPKDQVERRKAALNEDLNARRQEALNQFIERTNRVIKRVAEADKIDIVFIAAYYASTRVDITDRVMKEIDSGR